MTSLWRKDIKSWGLFYQCKTSNKYLSNTQIVVCNKHHLRLFSYYILLKRSGFAVKTKCHVLTLKSPGWKFVGIVPSTNWNFHVVFWVIFGWWCGLKNVWIKVWDSCQGQRLATTLPAEKWQLIFFRKGLKAKAFYDYSRNKHFLIAAPFLQQFSWWHYSFLTVDPL